MLLVIKTPFFPTKYSSISVSVLESDSRLLQKDLIIEKKPINSERKVIACSIGFEMCIAKLFAFKTILINKFLLIIQFKSICSLIK